VGWGWNWERGVLRGSIENRCPDRRVSASGLRTLSEQLLEVMTVPTGMGLLKPSEGVDGRGI